MANRENDGPCPSILHVVCNEIQDQRASGVGDVVEKVA